MDPADMHRKTAGVPAPEPPYHPVDRVNMHYKTAGIPIPKRLPPHKFVIDPVPLPNPPAVPEPGKLAAPFFMDPGPTPVPESEKVAEVKGKPEDTFDVPPGLSPFLGEPEKPASAPEGVK